MAPPAPRGILQAAHADGGEGGGEEEGRRSRELGFTPSPAGSDKSEWVFHQDSDFYLDKRFESKDTEFWVTGVDAPVK